MQKNSISAAHFYSPLFFEGRRGARFISFSAFWQGDVHTQKRNYKKFSSFFLICFVCVASRIFGSRTSAGQLSSYLELIRVFLSRSRCRVKRINDDDQ
jgi:hypothetical protein